MVESIENHPLNPYSFFEQDFVDEAFLCHRDEFEDALHFGIVILDIFEPSGEDTENYDTNTYRLAEISLRENHSDAFTRFVFVQDLKYNYDLLASLKFYDEHHRGIGIILEHLNNIDFRYNRRSLRKIFKGYKKRYLGSYYRQGGFAVPEKLFNQVIKVFESPKYDHISEDDVSFYNYTITNLAISVSWNTKLFFRALSCHTEFPFKTCNSEYVEIFERLLSNHCSSNETRFRFITLISVKDTNQKRQIAQKYIESMGDKPRWTIRIPDKVKEDIDAGLLYKFSIKRMILVEKACLGMSQKLYSSILDCIVLYSQNPSGYNECKFLQICSKLPPELYQKIVHMYIESWFGPLKIINGITYVP